MQNSLKYVIQTDSGKKYILHILENSEFNSKLYVGVFLFHNEEYLPGKVDIPLLRHRLLFENSVNAIKDKVIEYTSGRNEHITFIESYPSLAAWSEILN